MTIKRSHFLIATIAWFCAFLALSLTNYNGFELLNIFGFISLAILPGVLTIVISKIKGLPFWGYATLAVGFSLLELMLMALLGNTFLPFAGITRPLDKPVLLLELYLLISTLAVTAWMRMKDFQVTVKKYIFFDTLKDLFLSFTPIVFVALSIFGAIRLNNGGSNILTMILLGAMGAYILVLIRYSQDCDENTLPTAIFFMGLSLLLMTSFRGWFVTGHDIQTETQFFELTKNSGFWNISASSDAYNACLSITILPTIFANLLSVADQYIFKFFFQIFFALCPVLTYLICRNWTDRRISLLSAIYFLAFPTFSTDMPFIVRQEIAFVFFGLMLYLIFEPSLSIRMRRLLFMIMGIGVILSHYSTTYTVLIILILAILSRPLFNWILKLFKVSEEKLIEKPKITAVMAGVLLVLAFLWTSTITHTGGQVSIAVNQTVAAIQDGFAGNNRSIDAMNLLSFTKVDPVEQFEGYIQTVVNPLRAVAAPGTYFNASAYDQYSISLVNDQPLPITKFGKFIDGLGINFNELSALFGDVLAKLMEVLAPFGVAYIFFDKALLKKLHGEIYLISFYCLVFICLNIFLPVLSAQYGVFRAMQQSLFVLGFFIVVGSDAIGKLISRLWSGFKMHWFSSALIVAFLFYSSAFIPQLVGNNVPVLSLNNSGTYYDNYVTHGTEVAGIDWLVDELSSQSQSNSQIQFSIGADRLSTRKFESLADLTPGNDIFPSLVKRDSYLFLGEGTVYDDQASFSYNGDLWGYNYPIQFLNNNKNLIYNDGGARVYR